MMPARSLAILATLVLLGAAACEQYDTTDTTRPAPNLSAPSDSQTMPGVNQPPPGAPSNPNQQ
jgi:hypothetical protein